MNLDMEMDYVEWDMDMDLDMDMDDGHGIWRSRSLDMGYLEMEMHLDTNMNMDMDMVLKYKNPKFNMPKLHTNQLIFLSHNFVFCGYVHEHLAPYQFKITNASIILSHNSSWHEIVNNINRKIQTQKIWYNYYRSSILSIQLIG